MHNTSITIRNDLILDHMDLVENVVKTYDRRIIEQMDLRAYGVLGLVEAASRYDPERQNKFQTYALKWIKGQIIEGLIANLGAARRLMHLLARIHQTEDLLMQQYQKTVSSEEVCQYLEIDRQSYQAALSQEGGLQWASLDNEAYLACCVRESMTAYRESVYQRDLQLVIRESVLKLPSPEKEIIIGYYYRNMTCRDLVKVCHISLATVSRKHQSALRLLKTEILKNFS